MNRVTRLADEISNIKRAIRNQRGDLLNASQSEMTNLAAQLFKLGMDYFYKNNKEIVIGKPMTENMARQFVTHVEIRRAPKNRVVYVYRGRQYAGEDFAEVWKDFCKYPPTSISIRPKQIAKTWVIYRNRCIRGQLDGLPAYRQHG